MRNLTKVLAMVLALTMMVSVVGFAASYTDVEKGANYEEAVNVLSGLGLVQGMGDGTFGAELNLTRAQGAAFVIRLMGLEETAVSATGLDTGFADVAAEHWATGYIYTGVQKGIINGMGDGTFAPDAELTYAQLVTMVVKALGYEPLAAELGEWPGNYISAASQIKLTKGIAGVADATITRATTARVLYAALTIPKMEKDGVGVNATWKPGSTMILDDLGFYKLIGLIESVNYVDGEVNVSIDEQGKAVNGKYKELDPDDSDDDDYVDEVVDKNVFDIGSFGAELENYKGLTNTVMYVTYTNRDYVLVAVAEDNKDVDTISLTTADFEKVNEDGEVVYWTDAEQTEDDEFELADSITVYVNGGDAVTKTDEEFVDEYLDGTTDIFMIELKDAEDGDGLYDRAIITRYDFMVVGDIDVDRNGTYEITSEDDFSLELGTVVTDFEIDTEDDADEFVKIIKDGKEISVADIEVGDVLNIVTAENYTKALKVATIYVTNDTVEGQVKYVVDNEATIGDEVYDIATSGIASRVEGTFYLNILGQIIFVDDATVTSAYDYGFATVVEYEIDEVVESGNITILTTEGKWVTLDLKDGVEIGGTEVKFDEAIPDGNIGAHRKTESATNPKYYYNQIVAYKLNSEGAVKEILIGEDMDEDITNKVGFNATYEEYDNDDSELGSYVITEATVIFNLAEGVNVAEDRITSDDITVTDLSVLVDRKPYTDLSVYNVNDKTDVPAILVGKFVADINLEDAWFIVTADPFTTVYGDDEATQINGILNGEKVTYYAIDDESEIGTVGVVSDKIVNTESEPTITKGTIMIVKANANNEIVDATVLGDVDDYVTSEALVAANLTGAKFGDAVIDGEDRTSKLYAGLVAKVNGTKVDLVYDEEGIGAVLETEEKFVNKDANLPVNTDEATLTSKFTTTDSTVVTVYDFTASSKNTVSAGSKKDIKAGTAVFARVDEKNKLVEVVVIVTEKEITID